VSPARDRRRFGPGPYLLGLERDPLKGWPDGAGFPYDVPAVAALPSLDLGAPITLLAGDNGAGKSTIVEAVAAAIGFGAEGGELERPHRPAALPSPVLDEHLLPVVSATKPRGGYYLRAESFFNIARYIDEAPDAFAPDLSLYGGVPLHEQSHGQSFLALAANRFGGEGIFVLDEPEAALSVSGCLALLSIIARAASAGAQFIIATHSPILLACPGARISELSDAGLAPCAYDDLDAVRLTRGFLDAPERYLDALLRED
jgi:predicted ATPase